MWGLAATVEALIRFSFRVRCTAWRPICTRSSCLRRERVRVVRVLAEVAAAEAGSLVEASGAGAEARFEFPIMASTRGLNSWGASTTFRLLTSLRARL